MIAFFAVATLIWARALILQILNSEFDAGAWRSLSTVFYMIACGALAFVFAFFARSRLRGPPN
jgi:hypothetical protein